VQQQVTRETAAIYWRWAALDQRHELTSAALQDSVAEGERANARYAAGAVSADVPAQAALEYARIQSELAAITSERAAARSALALLVGDAPGTVAAFVPILPDANHIPAVEVGIPADVLARRPDLQASEWLLRASYADADVARALLYPQMTLTGNLGSRSSDLIDFFSRPVSSVVASLSLPILRWHQLRFGVRIADTNQALARNAFVKTFHRALKEVDDGLAQRTQFQRQYQAGSDALRAATRIEEMTAMRYRAGEVDASSWYRQRAARRAAALAQTSIHYEQLVNAIKLHQALGDDIMVGKEAVLS
jgi:outer membrane protein TolC